MENPAPGKTNGPLGLGRWPMIMGVATMVAFVGASAAINVRPWGIWVAVALMAGWVLLALLSAAVQDRRDRAAGRTSRHTSPERSKTARILEGSAALGGLACLGYSIWLDRQVAPYDAIASWSRTGFLLMLLSYVVGEATDRVIAWVSRRRTGR